MKIVKKLFGLSSASSAPTKTNKSSKPNKHDLVAIALGKQEHKSNGIEMNQAISDLAYGSELLELIKTPNKFSKAALQNLAGKLDDNKLDLETLRADLPELVDQLNVANHSNNPSTIEVLLEKVGGEEELVGLCEEISASSLRQRLIERVHGQNGLKRLEKVLKSSDKKAYKLIKQKLDAIKHAEHALLEARQKRNQFIQELTAHSARPFNKDYRFKYESLNRKFDTLFQSEIEPNDDLSALINEAEKRLADCRKTIDKAESKIEASDKSPDLIDEPVTADSLKLEQPAQKQKGAPDESPTLTRLYETLTRLLSPIALDESARQILTKELTELRSSANGLASAEQHTLFKLCKSADTLIHTLNNNETLRSALSALYNEHTDEAVFSELIAKIEPHIKVFSKSGAFRQHYVGTELAAALSMKKAAVKIAEENDKDTLNQITSLIQRAKAAARDGHLKRAQGIKYSAEEKLNSLRIAPEYIRRQWEELEQKVAELGDWQSYAITPKLESLLQSMKELAEVPKTAELQATKIKALQAEWKAMTKGSGKRHQSLWEEFKTYSDTAYEVCKLHYDKLDTIRSENTEKRQALIEQLKEYHSAYQWDSAEWNQVETVINSAKKEWHSYSPSLRAQQKEQQGLFEEAMQPIQAQLNSWYDKNKKDKERIILSLEPLTKSEDLAHAIEVAIQFQKQWKTIGRCRRREEEQLWKQFRAHCDSIFAKRDAEREQNQAIINAKITEAETIVEQAAAIAGLDDEAFEKTYRGLDDLKEKFNEIEGIPKGRAIAFDKKLNGLSLEAAKRLQKLHRQRDRGKWQNAFALKNKLIETGSKQVSDIDPSIVDEVKTLPGHIQKALNRSLTQAAIGEEAAEKQYRELCIRAETLNDIETPEEDKLLRMEVQVKQLQEGFGQSTASNEELSAQWLSAPNVVFANYSKLCKRFLASHQSA